MELIDKVNKYQAGGFMVYQPLPIIPPSQSAPQGVAAQEDSADSMEGGTLDKDLVKSLLGKGLTNDVMAFSKSIEDAYSQYSNMTETERSTTYGRRLRSVMRGDLGQLNMLVRNKELFDSAIKNIETMGADSDYAVTKRGVIVKDLKTNQLAEVSHEEFLNNYNNDNYRLLTNAELVNEREYNPNLVGDVKSIEALRSAVSINNVKDEVVKVLSNLGSDSKSASRDGYIYYGADSDPNIQAAAKQLIGMGAQGYYKINEMAESSTNEQNLQLAAQTMWANLSANSKSLLKARAIDLGADTTNIDSMAKELAISLLSPSATRSQKQSSSVDFDGTLTKAAGGSGGDDEALTDKVNFIQALESAAGDPDTIEIDSGSGDALLLQGFTPGSFLVENKPVGKTSMRNILPTIGGIVETRSVSIGGNIIPYNKLDSIVYDGEAVHTVKAPVRVDTQTRQVVPDFSVMERYNKAMEGLKSAKSRAAKEAVIRSNGFAPTVENGEIVPAVETDYFIVFDGSVNNRALEEGNDDINKAFLRQVGSTEEEVYDSLYKYDSMSGKTSDGEVVGTDYDKWWVPGDKVYKGKVFIKLRPNAAIAARFAGGDQPNIGKSANTPLNLGNQVNTRQQIMNFNSSGAKYTFE